MLKSVLLVLNPLIFILLINQKLSLFTYYLLFLFLKAITYDHFNKKIRG